MCGLYYCKHLHKRTKKRFFNLLSERNAHYHGNSVYQMSCLRVKEQKKQMKGDFTWSEKHEDIITRFLPTLDVN